MINKSGSGAFPGTNGKISNYDQVQERIGAGTLPGGGAYDASRMTVWRHKGGANVAFFDGHCAVAAQRRDLLARRHGQDRHERQVVGRVAVAARPPPSAQSDARMGEVVQETKRPVRLTAKQAPHRPDTAPAHGLRARRTSFHDTADRPRQERPAGHEKP